MCFQIFHRTLCSCELNTDALGLKATQSDVAHSWSDATASVPRIRLPSSTSARQEMLTDLKKAKKPITFEIEMAINSEKTSSASSSPSLSNAFVVPESLCVVPIQAATESPSKQSGDQTAMYPVNTEFVSIIVTPSVDGVIGIGGIRALEHKLELILTPPTEPLSQSIKGNNMLSGGLRYATTFAPL